MAREKYSIQEFIGSGGEYGGVGGGYLDSGGLCQLAEGI